MVPFLTFVTHYTFVIVVGNSHPYFLAVKESSGKIFPHLVSLPNFKFFTNFPQNLNLPIQFKQNSLYKSRAFLLIPHFQKISFRGLGRGDDKFKYDYIRN